jgi:hypothetical protein
VSGIWWSPSISMTAPSFGQASHPGCQKPGGIGLHAPGRVRRRRELAQLLKAGARYVLNDLPLG